MTSDRRPQGSGGSGPRRRRRRQRKTAPGGRPSPETPSRSPAADDAALPPTGFDPFELPLGLRRAIVEAGYEEPTEVQARLIPLALEGHDVIARSRTGTGKTCAFLLPALAALEEVADPDASPHPRGPSRILVVVPTRELAIQVAKEAERLCHFVPVATVCVYGGTPIRAQMKKLERSALVVGTPGRLLDHIGRRTLDPSTIETLVLDEVDRMYDMGFREDVDRILRACANRRQSILVSATLNQDVEQLAARHLGEHERILVESDSLTVDEVEQTFYVVRSDRKRELLIEVLKDRDPKRTIIFTRMKFTADRVAYALDREGFDAHEIHSGLPQKLREEILQRFRDGELEMLVATDVAARGLDIQGVDHVVNYDIPQHAEDYVHRVGRTARMGARGWAVSLIEPGDGPYLSAIEKLINREIPQESFPGFDAPTLRTRTPTEEKPASPGLGIPQWQKPRRRRR